MFYTHSTSILVNQKYSIKADAISYKLGSETTAAIVELNCSYYQL